MAFGDYTYQGTSYSYLSASLSHTFTGGTPTSGNLLVACFATGGLSSATTPSGWSVAVSQEYNANDQFAIIYYKISAGNETSIAWSNLNDQEEHQVIVFEFDGPFEASPLDKTNSSYNTTSQSSINSISTGTLSQAEEIAVAQAWNWNGDELDLWSINDGFTEQEAYDANSLMQLAGWDLTAATTAKNPTITFGSADGSDGSSWGSTAVIATFMASTTPETSGTLNGGGSISATVVNNTTTATVNGGGSISATASKFEDQIARPDSTITPGSWDTGPTTGQNLHDYTSDQSDATWIEDTAG